ncbi:hypothetical protein M422DRAFT_161534 [Sphaerobolus stellatus SS14]|nr:hypothetical protein M422DRAFT_161534 [Sphaerobolus stellatus SS14]
MSTNSQGPHPYFISVPDEQISLLKKKLEHTRFPDELDESGWAYGVPLEDVKRLAARWKDDYDWKENEDRLNKTLPQFLVDIPVKGFGTLNIHFTHKRSTVENAIPLLFVHGWPGSFIEVMKILPLLISPTSEGEPSFHVVAFSLPGYGFSEGPKKKGFSANQYAEVGHKLMQVLGYKEYGGDWGYLITRTIGRLYGPQYCKATHTNMAVGVAPQFLKNPGLYLKDLVTPRTKFERKGLERVQWFRSGEMGYSAEQSTKPQTLGYGLTDSPVGLLAWIYEKLVNWTDNYPWTDDEVLTWVSIYWFSRQGPAASLRIYYEVAHTGEWNLDSQKLDRAVLAGVSLFPKDIVVQPKTWMQTLANIVFIRKHDSGGHFAAYEKPNELAVDLRAMFGKMGPAYLVIQGQSGYKAPQLRDARPKL